MLRNLLLRTKQNNTHLLCTQRWFPHVHVALTSTVAADEVLLEQAHIDDAIRVNPTLAKVSPELWQRAHETFLNHGLQTSNFLRIVTSNPALLTRSPRKIIDAMELWRTCQFGEKSLFLLLTKYPELLDVSDGHRLRTRIGYLKTFASTNKNVWKLLMNCPNLLEQPERCIEEKVEYLKKAMRLEIPEIVKSEALSKPLDEIRCRHVFMERLGLFKPRPLKANPDDRTNNPRLYQITDTSEKTFATKICHVSLAEFEAFKELYQRELQRQRNTEDDDFSDDD